MNARRIAGIVGVIGAMSATVWAQPRKPGQKPQGEELDIRRRFGKDAAERLLTGPSVDRIRGIRRLATIGTPQAIDAIVQSQIVSALGSMDVRVRIEAVRALSRFVDQDEPRTVIVQALPGVLSRPDTANVPNRELGAFLKGTSAMALAMSGTPRAVQALVNEIRNEGPASAAAKAALLAYPPARLDTILGDQTPSAIVADLLGDLGDLRAIVRLRGALRSNDPKVQAAAAIALSKLGDADAAAVARTWSTNADPLGRLAAAKVLARLAPGEVAPILSALLLLEAQRGEAVDVALDAPSPALARPLAAMAMQQDGDPELRHRALVALGRCGGGEAVQALQGLLSTDVGYEAALALATAPGRDASKVIASALGVASSRTMALRMATIRKLVLGERIEGLDDAIHAALKGDDASRAAAVFTQVALGDREPDDPALLRDPVVLAAVARGALARGTSSIAKLLPALGQSASELRLLLEAPPVMAADLAEARSLDAERAKKLAAATSRRDALGVALMAFPDGGSLSSTVLRAWAEEGGALAPLALRALAARDDESYRARLSTIVDAGDVQMRSHHAAGLGHSKEADATGRLVSAYLYEPDARVRRSIIRALSRRTEPIRGEALSLAASLDPDTMTRSLARQAQRGVTLPEDAGGDLVAWISVASRAPSDAPVASTFRWERPEGVVVPVLPDPDGALILPLLPSGQSGIAIAARPHIDLVKVTPASSASASGSASSGVTPPAALPVP